ncbi:MAG TPA: transglycosylase SLT domain-containing protein [Candidatus Eisenbacteria bacterium]|nr:transglycosylase SLT domain-containing protein [Candidatus Eisenbacteria bacterium]
MKRLDRASVQSPGDPSVRCRDESNRRSLWKIGSAAVGAWLLLAGYVFTPSEIAGNQDPEIRVAAAVQLPQLPGLALSPADWRDWDSFFTFVIKRFSQETNGGLRDLLAELFLDLRYEVNRLTAGGGTLQVPVQQLFIDAWKRLSPLINQALPAMPQDVAARYAAFAAAADKFAAAPPDLGVLQLSPEALRGLALILEPASGVDPIAYNFEIDPALRNLLGLGVGPSTPAGPIPGTQSRLPRPPAPVKIVSARLPASPVAATAEASVKKLNKWVPDDDELEAYLLAVRALLVSLSQKLAAKPPLADDYVTLYRQIVMAAAWQESCWRQFVKKGSAVVPLASPSGDLGIMQVNRHTWRNLYDLKRLENDIEYNGAAGGEILHYYLTKHALKKKEQHQKGGHLARATYAAYNGGPSQMTRYRAAKQNPETKKIDDAFWEKFQAVSAGRELEVQSCYE